MKRAFALLCFVLAAATSGCSSKRTQFENGCLNDQDCPTGAYCRRASAAANEGLCACRSDEACEAGEICNSQGICQKRQDCRSNVDCEAARFCDLGTGACLERTQCGLDLHCLPGQYCGADNVCQFGCLDTADCPLYQSCEAGQCVPKCGDKTFCEYGDQCVNGACVPVVNDVNCQPCDPGVDGTCGSFNNFCLINSSYEPNDPSKGPENFCGTDCRQENDCPSGYNCGTVVVVFGDQCTADNQCGGGGRRCLIGEGQNRGFCSCAVDRDCSVESFPPRCLGTCGGLGLQECAQGTDCISGNCVIDHCQWPVGQGCTQDAQCQRLPLCAPIGPGGQNYCVNSQAPMPCNSAADCTCVQGRCSATGRSCNTAADCNVTCVEGGCLIGSTCAPIQGLLCPDVR